MQSEPGGATTESEPTVLDVLDLEEIDRDLYRSTLVFADTDRVEHDPRGADRAVWERFLPLD